MVRSQKSIGGVVGIAVGKARYKSSDRTEVLGEWGKVITIARVRIR